MGSGEVVLERGGADRVVGRMLGAPAGVSVVPGGGTVYRGARMAEGD